ncbi:MAG: hypothetical protein JSR77_04880 [Planctomycetes bacterium]|nr:hypothetical protein [Planctomycetota bacterium]
MASSNDNAQKIKLIVAVALIVVAGVVIYLSYFSGPAVTATPAESAPPTDEPAKVGAPNRRMGPGMDKAAPAPAAPAK